MAEATAARGVDLAALGTYVFEITYADGAATKVSLTEKPTGTTVPAGNVANGILATGSGEPPTSCIGAAIANAFFDATGVRIREAPLTPARVRAVLKAAGSV